MYLNVLLQDADASLLLLLVASVRPPRVECEQEEEDRENAEAVRELP